MHISCNKDISLCLENSDCLTKVGSMLFCHFLDLNNCQNIFLSFSIPSARICCMLVIKENRKVASIFSIWIFKLTSLCWERLYLLVLRVGKKWNSNSTSGNRSLGPYSSYLSSGRQQSNMTVCKETNKLHGSAAPGTNGWIGAHLLCLFRFAALVSNQLCFLWLFWEERRIINKTSM